MKTYIVYVNGVETGYIKAGSHNAAEKKAKKKYSSTHNTTNSDGWIFSKPPIDISVAYTEI